MFWSKNVKLPVTEEDKNWVEEALLSLAGEFGEDYFKDISIILPNRKFYDCDFSCIEGDAEFVLEQTKIYMDIENVDFKLCYFSDQSVEMQDGTPLTTQADLNGEWNSAAGIYEQTDEGTTIYIERSLLKNPSGLIATMAHELSHYILLGEGRISDNDEYLTDLVAIAYGFGIFTGNSRFEFDRYSTGQGSGWRAASRGYLPEQVIAYAMAWLSVYRNEDTSWKGLLSAQMLKYFEQSMKYIEQYPDRIRFE